MSLAEVLPWAALVLSIITATALLVARDWRWRVGFLAAQYLSAFLMVQLHWPISMAAAKLVTGWMACAVLGIAQLNSARRAGQESAQPHGILFYLFTACILLAATFATSLSVAEWLDISLPTAWCSLLLLGLGLLQLGVTAEPFRVVVGLLTVFSGFEILYATVESSILVTALLAVVNLGFALAGAYFLVTSGTENA